MQVICKFFIFPNPSAQYQSNIKVQQRAKLGSFFQRPKAPIIAVALASERRRV
jgi:hypothetical protein